MTATKQPSRTKTTKPKAATTKAARSKPAAAKTASPKAPQEATRVEQSASTAIIPETVRNAADQGFEAGRKTYDTLKDASETTIGALDSAAEVSRKAISDVSTAHLNLMKTHTEASLAFFQSVTAVRTFSDALDLQMAFVRDRADAFTRHGQFINEQTSTLAQDLAQNLGNPIKTAVEKTWHASK